MSTSATKFLTANQWVLAIDDIDAYSVLTVELPFFSRENQQERTMHVSIGHFAASSTLHSLVAWLDSKLVKKGSLKFFDDLGKVVEAWDLEVSPMQLWCDPLDSESSSKRVTHLQMHIDRLDVSSTSAS